MADISKISDLSGTIYNIKDAQARSNRRSWYGTCATAAATQAKAATVEGLMSLAEGDEFHITFTNAQTYNGVPTLNINSLGAKNIRRVTGTNAARYEWSAGETIDFVYNGTYFLVSNGAFATTTYYGRTKLYTGATGTSTALAATPATINNLALNMISGAPVYSTSATYAVGDRVRYSYQTWECITAITTAEAWNAAHWKALEPLQEQIDDLVDKTSYVVPIENIENPTLATSTAAAVINDALEYANQNGIEIVLLPPGEYLINETIYLQDNVILKGSGTASTKLKIATGYNIDCIRVDHPVHDAGIKDLTIDGNKIDNYSYFHQSTEHGNAINVWLHRGIIENVRTEYVYKHALLMNYDVGSSTADGLGFDSADEYQQGNLNKVMHCNFDNSTLEGVMWGWRTMDSWFCYNNIGSNGANLYLEGGTSRFIGNHFDGDGDDGIGPEYNVFCPNGCNTMLFEGNIFENTKKHNFYFQQPSYNADASYGIQIINNIIRTGSKAQDATYNLIEISGYSDSNKNHDIVISGNSLLNPNLNENKTKYGIHLAYCDNVTIGNNTFYNIAQDNIKIENSCSNIFIDGIDKDIRYNGVNHNGCYRGKNLGTLTSSDIEAFCTEHEIAQGNFKDLYLGDYFVLQDGTYNVEWMIAAFDYSFNYKSSSTAWITNHAIAIIPRGAGIEKRRFHSSNVTTSGIRFSELGEFLYGSFTSHFAEFLGDHVGEGMISMSNAADADGVATGISTGTMPVVIPCEVEFFGSITITKNPNTDCTGKRLLPVFNFITPYQFSNENYWLCGNANGTQYVCTRLGGAAPFRANATSVSYYVRPMIFIK